MTSALRVQFPSHTEFAGSQSKVFSPARSPEIGDNLPGFSLIDQWGNRRDLHIDRADSKAAVVFYRSAVW